jgi:hypothetical protein
VLISFKDLVVLKDQPVTVLISGPSLRRRTKRPDQVGTGTPLPRTQPVWSTSGVLPDDSVLLGIAEKVLPAIPDRPVH